MVLLVSQFFQSFLALLFSLCYTTSTSNFGQDIFIMFQRPQKSLAKISFLNFICFFSKEFTQIFDEVTHSPQLSVIPGTGIATVSPDK